jgi:hypothetical protein
MCDFSAVALWRGALGAFFEFISKDGTRSIATYRY